MHIVRVSFTCTLLKFLFFFYICLYMFLFCRDFCVSKGNAGILIAANNVLLAYHY